MPLHHQIFGMCQLLIVNRLMILRTAIEYKRVCKAILLNQCDPSWDEQNRKVLKLVFIVEILHLPK